MRHESTAPLVLLTGGGTMGPVTPLLAVVPALRELVPAARFAWIGTRGGPERPVVEAAGIGFEAIATAKLHRSLDLRNLLMPFRLLAGLCQAWRRLGALRPAVVVSAGGYVAVPVIWAARLRRIPVHVHQQDLRPTLTNVITAPFALSVSVAFEKSARDFRRYRPVVTGNPVRPEVLAGSAVRGRQRFGFQADRPVTLVTGGGTGAARINEAIAAALPRLLEVTQILHLTGRGKALEAPALGGYVQREFLAEEMPDALAMADLVVTRAGLGALSELAVLGKPALIVPMRGTHQEDNARYFAERGAGVFVDEASIAPERLAALCRGLLGRPGEMARLGAAMKTMNPADAAGRLAAQVKLLLTSQR
jgi:UDP-N-acetylglucosamine--N-acetylmuramyl-(pentapeptide) pyrophosphoryl-undecaprenol N-acetylglucosamine transferase